MITFKSDSKRNLQTGNVCLLAVELLVDEGEAGELVPPHVVEDVARRLVRWSPTQRQILELPVKILCFSRIRLRIRDLLLCIDVQCRYLQL